MKLLRYRTDAGSDWGVALNGRVYGRTVLESLLGKELPESVETLLPSPMFTELQQLPFDQFRPLMRTSPEKERMQLLHPIPFPPKIVCVGLNYQDHAEEQGVAAPSRPVIFFKPRTALTGPCDSIVWPSVTQQLDYEGELAVVIRRAGKYIRRNEAFDHVAGYTVFNDVSARDIQFGDRQWSRGKSFDTFAPMGPWLVTHDEIGDPHSLSITTKVSGEVRQSSSTARMIIKIPELISELSRGMTFEPGDIIASGTPAGVGIFAKPNPRLLREGDIVEISIQRVGTIKNRVVRE